MEDAERQILAAESDMILLPASDGVCREGCKIVVKHRLTGVQVHDARLAAVMYVHGVRLQGRRFQPTRRLTVHPSPSDSRSGFDATHTAELKVS